MKEYTCDAAVIGGGAAGMAAALEVEKHGFVPAIVERDEQLGGILLQCIHNGFGLTEFNEELTGPEYADNFIKPVLESGTEVFLNTTVTSIERKDEKGNSSLIVNCVNSRDGIIRMRCRAVILAMGCRERNRGNLRIPGTRPAGIYTAGLAQRLINMEGYLPGKDTVIIGSGDIGLIMARRMIWSGCKVHAVVEILPYPSGLTRNIVQCLSDFDIPLYLNHIVSKVYGKHRVEGVDIMPIENGIPVPEKIFHCGCDTLLLSVGLIPENELSKETGVILDPQTGGPLVDSRMMTSVEGIFAAGNVLHVHDIVDYVSDEARRTGKNVIDFLNGVHPSKQVRIKAGSNVRYVNPAMLDTEQSNKLYFRSLIVKNKAVVEISIQGEVVKTIKKPHVQPSEMISVSIKGADIKSSAFGPESVIEVSIR